jgi:tRNA dimethylallyltransferase
MKILVICGLTASGKTSLALKIAKKIGNACIISVDSRQAYQGLPVLSGQDIPTGFTRHTSKKIKYANSPAVYFEKSNICIWGIDQVPPTEMLNISSFTKFVWEIVKKETLTGKKIILVGGTGLYLKAITKPLLDIHTGFNAPQRKKLSLLSLQQLTKKLKKLDDKKFLSLNQSDRLNPRRLIRAIEILLEPNTKKPAYFKLQGITIFKWIGLNSNLDILEKNIRSRVIKRLKNQAIKEALTLQSHQKNLKAPIYSTLGLTQIKKYLDKKITKKELISAWTQDDLRYAKRQLTWFKKQSEIIWYDKDSNKEKIINSLGPWLKK